jgi:hypothetical protein
MSYYKINYRHYIAKAWMLSLLTKYIHGQAHLVIFRWIVPRRWILLLPPDVTSIYFINYEWLQLSDPLLEL